MGRKILQHGISLLRLIAIHGRIIVNLCIGDNGIRHQVAV
jgi:hypothetical protein